MEESPWIRTRTTSLDVSAVFRTAGLPFAQLSRLDAGVGAAPTFCELMRLVRLLDRPPRDGAYAENQTQSSALQGRVPIIGTQAWSPDSELNRDLSFTKAVFCL